MKKFIMFLILAMSCSPALAVTKNATTYNDLKEALADAQTDVIIVTGNISVEATLEINRNVTIKAADNTQPVLELIASSGAVMTIGLRARTFNLDGLTITGGKSSGLSILGNRTAANITNCIFTKNSSDRPHNSLVYGGGMTINADTVNVKYCKFIANDYLYNQEGGGGILVHSVNKLNIENCLFSKNTSKAGGGGMYLNSKAEIKNCTFIENEASYDGGGIYIDTADGGTSDLITLTNCTITENTASGNGGGFYINTNSIVANIINCTISANNAKSEGAEIYINKEALLNLVNSLVWNTGKNYVRLYGKMNAYNCVFAAIRYGIISPEDNANLDSCFYRLNWYFHKASPKGESASYKTVYHLADTNFEDWRLIDLGLTAEEIKAKLNLSEAPDIKNDQLGIARTNKPDPGAVEVELARTNPTVSSYKDLKDALENAQIKSVTIARDIDVEATLNITHDIIIRAAEDTKPVLRLTAPSGAVILSSADNIVFDIEGLTFTGGKLGGLVILGDKTTANIKDCTFTKNYSLSKTNTVYKGNSFMDLFKFSFGGGMTVWGRENSTVNIEGCTFTENSADMRGGGIVAASDGNLNIDNCTFSKNTAGSEDLGISEGGGMSIIFGKVKIEDCKFIENVVTERGGGIEIFAGNAEIENCEFIENAAEDGGGIFGSVHSIKSCRFIKNVASNNGGGTCCLGTDKIESCAFIDNTAKNDGGGLYGRPQIDSCVFLRNVASHNGGGLYIDEPSGTTPSITNCTITENIASGNGGGFCIDTKTKVANIINCTSAMNTAEGEGAEIFIDSGNLNLVNSVIWNDAKSYIRANSNISMYNCAYKSSAVSAAENVTVKAEGSIRDINWTGRKASPTDSMSGYFTAFRLSTTNTDDQKLIDKGLTSEEIKAKLNLSEAPDLSKDQSGTERQDRPDIGAAEAASYEDNSGGGYNDDEDNAGNENINPVGSSGGGCDTGVSSMYALILAVLVFCKWYNTRTNSH